jgi:hypothetical protein
MDEVEILKPNLDKVPGAGTSTDEEDTVAALLAAFPGSEIASGGER